MERNPDQQTVQLQKLLAVAKLVSSDIDIGIRPGKALRERLRLAIQQAEKRK